MEQVVSFSKSFTTIFYFKNFELGKDLFGSIKLWMDLNLFKTVWISFESISIIWMDLNPMLASGTVPRDPTGQPPLLPPLLLTATPPTRAHRPPFVHPG
jgi:hypothetical protein